ncbi:hypothetical protein FKM82_001460 [Ascaphus truei]
MHCFYVSSMKGATLCKESSFVNIVFCKWFFYVFPSPTYSKYIYCVIPLCSPTIAIQPVVLLLYQHNQSFSH